VSVLCSATTWAWNFSVRDDHLVILANAAAAAGFWGPLVSASLFAISNRCYPSRERVKATAIRKFIAVIGAGGALMVSSVLATDKELVDLTL